MRWRYWPILMLYFYFSAPPTNQVVQINLSNINSNDRKTNINPLHHIVKLSRNYKAKESFYTYMTTISHLEVHLQ